MIAAANHETPPKRLRRITSLPDESRDPPGLQKPRVSRTQFVAGLVAQAISRELQALAVDSPQIILCFSDAAWRRAMNNLGCPVYTARLASPTTRRSTRGKLGMATICHFRHLHAAVVYVKTRGRTEDEILLTARHEALHIARPGMSHRQIDAYLRRKPLS
jgi:hypothetical protein